MKDVFALRARNNRIPSNLLRVRFFALLSAGKIILGVENDQQNSRLRLAAVVLDFFDVAQIHIAGGAALRFREFLSQPCRHEAA